MFIADCKLLLRLHINASFAGCKLSESAIIKPWGGGFVIIHSQSKQDLAEMVDFSRSMSPAFGVACVGSEARLCNAHRPLDSCGPADMLLLREITLAHKQEMARTNCFSLQIMYSHLLFLCGLWFSLCVLWQEGGRVSMSVGVLEQSDGWMVCLMG